jgi:hypothetical protein
VAIQKYKIKNIRFKSNRRIGSLYLHNIVSELCKWAISDYACYKIINDFFNTNRHNTDSRSIISSRIDRLREEQKKIYNNEANNYCFYKVKGLILNLFENSTISDNDYRKVYSDYIEHLTMQWKKYPGRYGKVFYEPLIKYKRNELFANRDFANSKCDVVYKNNREKSLSIYECKFGLLTFFSHLRMDINTAPRNLRKKGIRARRKINYLNECKRIFSSNSDIINLDVKIITLATRSSLRSSSNLLGGIDVITREDLEDRSFYNSLKKE